MEASKLTLCKASAGSGKTFTLAKSYIKIVLRNPKVYDRILAVTFTNKATEEMKTRILNFLTEISKVDSEQALEASSITRVLLSEMPGWDYRSIAFAARQALSNILHDYSHFSILTIDKFFNRMVRSFVYELKLQNAANVSMDTELAMDAAVAEIMAEYSHGGNELISRWLRDIAMENLEDGKKWQPADTIRKLSGELLKERTAHLDIHYPADRVAALLEQLREREARFKTVVAGLAEKVNTLLVGNAMNNGFFPSNYFPKQTAKMIREPASMAYSESVLKMIGGEENPFTRTAQKRPEAAEYLQIWESQIRPVTQDLVRYHTDNITEYRTIQALKRHLRSVALLAAVADKMKDYRERQGVFLISDNNQLINKIIRNADAPFLYEKLGNKFRYIMLDEFQDTSDLQWKNFLPLFTEVLSHNEDSQVLIVGDAKQAIYRWRGGNLHLIQKGVEEDLPQFWKGADSELILGNNFRSRSEIVAFNNDLFEPAALLAQELIMDKYGIDPRTTEDWNTLIRLFDKRTSVQEPKGDPGGFIELKFFLKENNRSNQEEDAISEEEVQLAYLKNTIEELISIYEYRLNDIAVLVRKNGEAVQIAQHLSEWGYQVLTADALLFNKHPAIRLILDALRFIEYPKEELFRTALLYRYAKLHRLDEAYPDLLEKDAREQYFRRWLSALNNEETVRVLGALSLSQIVRRLMDILDVHPFRDVYTEQFLDVLHGFEMSSYSVSVTGFLEWWGEKERSVTISGDANAIQVVTIHRSKGLEYKVVILPYFNWKVVEDNYQTQPILWPEISSDLDLTDFQTLPVNFLDARDTWFTRDFQQEVILQACDNLNITYVALTRAIDKLYVMADIHMLKDGSVKSDRVGGLIYNSLRAAQPGAFIDDLLFRKGTLEAKEEKRTAREKSTYVLEIGKQSRQERVPLAPLTLQSSESFLGEVIHEVIAQYRPKIAVDQLLDAYLYRNGLAAEVAGPMMERIHRFFTHPEIVRLYTQPGWILTEREIFYKGVSYRFDVLIVNDNNGKLYDFKTGAVKKTYEKQLKIYKEALEATGLNIVEAALIYIDEAGNPIFQYI